MIEEAVHRLGERGPHTENRGERVRPGTEVRDVAEEFERMPLLLERERRVRRTEQRHLGRVELDRLALPRRGDETTARFDRGARAEMPDRLEVRDRTVDDDLEVREAAPVVQREEDDRLAVAGRTDPAADDAFGVGGVETEEIADSGSDSHDELRA